MSSKIIEGSAIITGCSPTASPVFYNKVQAVNRDLSVCVIQAFVDLLVPQRKIYRRRKGIRILEAFSASGIRSIRYAKEIQGIERIIANDMDPKAVQMISHNLELNNVSSDLIIPNKDEANELMDRLKRNPKEPRLVLEEPVSERGALLQQIDIDVIDIDPYGTASPFLDNAMHCILDGGLLCVTSTDSAVLCGKYPEKCMSLYGSIAFTSEYCHEFAIRVLLGALERSANKRGRYIKPLLSLHIDFYIRVFVQVFTQPCITKLAPTKMSYVLQCTQCSSFNMIQLASVCMKRGRSEDTKTAQTENTCSPCITTDGTTFKVKPCLTQEFTSHCTVCQSSVRLTGPIYNQHLYDKNFANCVHTIVRERSQLKLLARGDRVEALLNCIVDELHDVPLYYNFSQLCSSLGIPCPSLLEVVSALNRLGFRVSQTHCNPQGFKTDAPARILYGVVKCWAENKGYHERLHNSIIKAPSLSCDLTPDMKFDIGTRSKSLKKFLPHPEVNWGPKCRHDRASGSSEQKELLENHV